jgi:hypothetical protein
MRLGAIGIGSPCQIDSCRSDKTFQFLLQRVIGETIEGLTVAWIHDEWACLRMGANTETQHREYNQLRRHWRNSNVEP